MTLESSITTEDAVAGCGRVVFVFDETPAMNARVADGTKSKAESAATAVNALLGQLGTLAGLEVALVGYRGDGQGEAEVGCRWDGALAGSGFVSYPQLAAHPVAVEQRVRRVPAASGVGLVREETVAFPVWYVPQLGEPLPGVGVGAFCRQLLADAAPSPALPAKPPLLVHVVGDIDAAAADRALELGTGEADPPLVFHAHLATSSRVPPTLYPSSDALLPPGPLRQFFAASSPLPEPLAAAVATGPTSLNAGARGLVLNARLADLIRFLTLVKAFALWQPAADTNGRPEHNP